MPIGGKRPGAGRKKGIPNKSTADVKAAALQYAPGALKRLAYLYENAGSEQAQVSACKEILDRAYGKSPQAIVGDPNAPVEVRFCFKLDTPNADD